MDRPWSPDCTGAALVEQELIAAFREAQGRAIYSCRQGNLHLVSGEHISGLDLIALTATFLGRRSFERKALLTFCRCEAERLKVAPICREMGWKRTTFEEARRRAAKVVATGLHGVITGTILLAEEPPWLTARTSRPLGSGTTCLRPFGRSQTVLMDGAGGGIGAIAAGK